jgi:hypothetical protein
MSLGSRIYYLYSSQGFVAFFLKQNIPKEHLENTVIKIRYYDSNVAYIEGKQNGLTEAVSLLLYQMQSSISSLGLTRRLLIKFGM